MAKRECPFCKEKVQEKATICKHCKSELPPLPPKKWYQTWKGFILILFILLIFVRVFKVGPTHQSTNTSVTSKDVTHQSPKADVAPSSGNSNCKTYNPAQSGWLLDFDRRGEVALWEKPAPPFQAGNKIAAVIAYPNMPLGESMITDVTEECLVDGILYYHIRFDDTREGWVDVAYLHWKKIRR